MSTPWTVTIGDQQVREATITGDEAVDIARLAGLGWDSLSPLASPASLVAIIAVLRATRLGDDIDDALAVVKTTPIADLLTLVTVDETPVAAEAG